MLETGLAVMEWVESEGGKTHETMNKRGEVDLSVGRLGSALI